MISNYNLDCGYHNFELKDKIYLVPDYALKVIYTDGFNEVVFQGDSSNVTLLEGHEITFQEETSFDERFKFSKTLSLKVNGYKTFNDLDYRYYAIIETKDSEFYLVNVDFPSFVTHTYTLNANANETELVFSSQSNIATLKLTNFEPNNVNSCKEYSTSKIKNVKLTESWGSSLSTWQKSLVNKGDFVDIEPLPDSISLTEEFDGEKYTVTLGFDIPMSYYKNDWHIKLLQFTENKYRGYIQLEGGILVFVGYNVGLFPSYTINGDIISIRLQEVAIRGIAYGNDYAIIDTNIPNSIEFSGATCKNYNFESSCDWEVEDKPDYITITPTSGQADTQYELTICNTDDETGYAVSEFIIKTCNARVRPEVVIKNPIYRYTATTETVCSEITNERWVESGTTCAGTHGVDKYSRSIKQISYDSATTWYNTDVESATTLIERNSPDCGYAERWVESGTTCVGYNKYTNSYKQISYNSGSTWTTPQPIQYSATTLIEADSPDCGYVPKSDQYLTFVAREDCKFTYGCIYNVDLLAYSLDSGSTWNGLQGYTETPTIHSGDTIMWKRNCDTCYGITAAGFTSTGNFDAEGNAMSLVWGDDFIGKTSFTNNRQDTLSSLFSGCGKLINASQLVLPATTLGKSCYAHMFEGCTSLVTAPDLPATTLTQNCYHSMFKDCTSLTLAPDLNSTSLGKSCYAHMFNGCTSLRIAPTLPATSLEEACYYGMFNGCTSLTETPKMSATTLASGCCQYMFAECSSLTIAQVMPATTCALYCYKNMFSDCTSLTTAPTLPATSLRNYCYYEMFRGCTSLTTAPQLPATSMYIACYYGMFRDCVSLTTAPQLPAIWLSKNCYNYMFNGCAALNEIVCLATGISPDDENRTTGWVSGVASSGTFYKNANSSICSSVYNCMWQTGVNGIPSGWNVVDYTG